MDQNTIVKKNYLNNISQINFSVKGLTQIKKSTLEIWFWVAGSKLCVREYESILSVNCGEIRALTLYGMARWAANETLRHLILAFFLIIFVHSGDLYHF